MYFVKAASPLVIMGVIAIMLVSAPVTLDTTSPLPHVIEQTAFANNGNGRGNGGNNNGGSNNGNESRGNNGRGNENKNDNGKTSSEKDATPKPSSQPDAASEPIEIRHGNGMTETLRRGRYVMKDARGRTIVNRRATSADIRRLGQYAHH